MRWGVLDLETTINFGYKRKADPFGDNWVVMAGWCSQDKQHPEGRRYTRNTWRDSMREDFAALLSKTTLLVGQNIKFDLLYLFKDKGCYELWKKWVVAGGRIWDVQVAEYLLQGMIQQAHMLSLDDMCIRYGLDVKVDEVKALWEAGVPTEEIDPDLLSRYLLGEDLKDWKTGEVTGRREGDIGNTRDIFLKQVPQVRDKGLSRVVLANMESLMCTIEMEYNGMYVDVELGQQIAKELQDELDAVTRELNQYIPDDLPFEFNWGNRYHLSPVLFGGSIKYQEREVDLKDGTRMLLKEAQRRIVDGSLQHSDLMYSQKEEQHYILKDGSTVAVDSYCPGDYNEDQRETFKGGKNVGEFKTRKVKVDNYDKPKSRMVDALYNFKGYAKADPSWKRDDGLYSVAADVIEELTAKTDVPFLQVLGRVNAISKDLSTYFISTDNKGNDVGMLTQVRDNSIIHHSINSTATVTGRFSSSNPNLQNLPKGNKSRAKEVFISRFGPKRAIQQAVDGVIIQSDFSSLEVYIQAILTRDAQLIDDLVKGRDIHCVRLALKKGMPYEEVERLCKGYYKEDGTFVEPDPVWDLERTDIKPFTFQRSYGAGARKIAATTGMTVEEVEALIAEEIKTYPGIEQYFQNRMRELERNSVPTSTFVMHPANPAVKVNLRIARVAAPSGKLYSFITSPSFEWQLRRGIRDGFSPTEAKNYDVQGEGGEWMKLAMGLALREFYRRDNFAGLAFLVNTVHDALYADAAESVKKEVAIVIHACMEAASDMYAWWYGVDIPLQVPSDTSWGNSMLDEIAFRDQEFKQEVAKVREELRVRYMKGHKPTYLN